MFSKSKIENMNPNAKLSDKNDSGNLFRPCSPFIVETCIDPNTVIRVLKLNPLTRQIQWWFFSLKIIRVPKMTFFIKNGENTINEAFFVYSNLTKQLFWTLSRKKMNVFFYKNINMDMKPLDELNAFLDNNIYSYGNIILKIKRHRSVLVQGTLLSYI